MEEVGVRGTTRVTDFNASHGGIRTYDITPEEFGLERADPAALVFFGTPLTR
jgi:anthranilate phosphoribosyltransferase